MNILYFLQGLYLLFFGTWLFYVAFMHLKKYKTILQKIKFLYYGLIPFYVLALLMDVLFDKIIGTIYFRELPREWLFTARCQRHMKGSGTQLKRATFVCTYLLNPFDEGHCD